MALILSDTTLFSLHLPIPTTMLIVFGANPVLAILTGVLLVLIGLPAAESRRFASPVTVPAGARFDALDPNERALWRAGAL